MSEEHKWRHLLSYTKLRGGKWRGTCVCGWQSEKAWSTEEVDVLYKEHVGLVEKERRPDGR